MLKILIITSVILLTQVDIGSAQRALSDDQVQRLKAVYQVIKAVEDKPFEQIREDISRSPYPDGALQIKEAIALTYQDIVHKQGIEDERRRRKLYGLILLNMAFFQLGGDMQQQDTSLHNHIQSTLKSHIDPVLFERSELFHSLED